MNELEDLRHALRSPPGFAPRALDLDTIVARGGRLRARRRLAASAAAALAVAAVLVGGGVWVNHDRVAGPAPVAPAAPGPGGHPRATDATARPGATPAAADDEPIGAVVRTGMRAGGGEWVLYAVPVNVDTLPTVHFGVMLGVQAGAAAPVPAIVVNETRTSDRAPGFHGSEAPMTVDNLDTPAFGYFVGPAARITATVHGKQVSAHLHPWSEDPQVIFFWFDRRSVGPNSPAADLTAVDRTGRQLAATKSGFGVG